MIKNPPANAGDKRYGLYPWVGEIPWRRAWQPTPIFLLGESHGERSLEGYSPWGHKELDTTQHSTAQQQGKAPEFAFPTSSGWCCCSSGIAVRTSAPQCGTQQLLGYFCSPCPVMGVPPPPVALPALGQTFPTWSL